MSHPGGVEQSCPAAPVTQLSTVRDPRPSRYPADWLRAGHRHLLADANAFTPQAIQVLTVERGRIGRVHGFVRRTCLRSSACRSAYLPSPTPPRNSAILPRCGRADEIAELIRTDVDFGRRHS